MRRNRLVVIGGVSVILGVTSANVIRARAGQPPADAPPPVFRSAVDVVQIDVSVLDKTRKPVRGLTSDDFTVLEDGKPRPIVAFTPVDLPSRAPAPAAGAAPASWTRDVAPDVSTNAAPEDGRLVVIMFDWSIRPEDQADARRIAATAVNNLGPGDQAAVVFSNPASVAGTPQNFTADHARLLEAVGRPMAAAEVSHSSTSPSTGDRRNVNGGMLDDPEGYESGDCGCRRCVMEDITQIADLVRDVPGRRKVLLFIGSFFQGFELVPPVGGPPPAPGVNPFRPQAGDPPADISTTGKQFNLWPGWCAGVLQAARNDMERATGLANLTIDAIDPAGLAAPGDDPMGGTTQFSMKRRDDLHIMPDATGGRTVVNTNEPESQVPSILDESGSYYLIGFSRANGVNDGKLHSVDVKVKRSGVDVRTRNGYYATDELAAANAPESLPVGKALDRVLPDSAIPLAATAAAFAAPGNPAAGVAVVIDVNNPVVAAPAGGGAAASSMASTHDSVLAAMFDATGHAVASSQQTITLTRRAGSSGPYEIFARLPSNPGRYEVRVAVDGEPRQRGTVYTFVDVPDFAKDPLSLSGVLIHAEPPVPAPPPDVFGGLVPFAPTAKRTFAPVDRVTAFLNVYEAAAAPTEEAAIEARVLDDVGRAVFDEPSTIPADTFAGARSVPYRVDLPLATLAPGEYLLTVTATRDKTVVRRDLRFTVVPAPRSANLTAPLSSATNAVAAAPASRGDLEARAALDGVLSAVGRYLDDYGRSLANVVAEESYVQVVDASSVARRLRSDVVFMTDTPANWVAFRDVFQMDGKAVRDRDNRLAKLLGTGTSPGARQQATRIAQESARFNLNVDGVSVNRSLNVPISALLFLQAQNQHRSAFKLDRVETTNGRQVATVEFEETAMPRLIGSSDNTAMHGSATVDVQTGRVLHTELSYATRAHLVYPTGAVEAETSVRIGVNFAENAKLGLCLPVSMDEWYVPTMLSDSRGRSSVVPALLPFGGTAASVASLPALNAHATYANFRQFGVNVGTDVGK